MDEAARILALLPKEAARWPLPKGEITQIRLRAGRPACLISAADEREGDVTDEDWIACAADLLCGHSLYARENELEKGYLALEDGSRAGVCGRWSGGRIVAISSLCLRIAREKKGCAEPVMPFLYENGRPVSTLILSSPGLGKTTLLRDIARQFSCGTVWGRGVSVAVADERRELGGAGRLDLGERTDVMEGCGRVEAMEMLVRTMAPDVIVTDELGRFEEAEAVREAVRCGVAAAVTAHAADIASAGERRVLGGLLKEKIFERIIVLKGGVGRIENIYDANACPLMAEGDGQ